MTSDSYRSSTSLPLIGCSLYEAKLTYHCDYRWTT